MAELPTVTVQVIRPEDGLHTALTPKFVVLDFESRSRNRHSAAARGRSGALSWPRTQSFHPWTVRR
jgi:hypothetical protein